MLGLQYKQWTLASFNGQIGFNWQHDRYDQAVLFSPNGRVIPNRGGLALINAIEKKRRDNVYALTLQLGKSLTSSVTLQFSASLGSYDSTINDHVEDFYRFVTHLAWHF
jgi:hypothetical protein